MCFMNYKEPPKWKHEHWLGIYHQHVFALLLTLKTLKTVETQFCKHFLSLR